MLVLSGNGVGRVVVVPDDISRQAVAGLDMASSLARGPVLIGSDIYRHSIYGRNHPLSIPRVSSTIDLICALDWLPAGHYMDSPLATASQLARFHCPAYIAAIIAAERDREVTPEVRERFNIGRNGNPIFPEIFSRPATSAGGSMMAAKILSMVPSGTIHSPAGGTHHGRRDQASGFCYFNDPVLAILTFLDHGISPILYVDLDAHHGDGVEVAFQDNENVLTISVHEDGRWPGTGLMGDRAGGTARNLPVPKGFNDSELDFLVNEAIVPLGKAWQPAAVVLQTGVDALADDPQSKLSLSNRAIWRAVKMLLPLATRRLVVGGGGYNPWAVARAWTGIWAVLNGIDPAEEDGSKAFTANAEAVLRGLHWNHSRGRNPPDHWFTKLADDPNPGPISAAVRAVAKDVLR